jgi:hypothetical protein
MPRRPLSTTSERELILSLAEEGRAVTLNSLTGWRKEGLLPPLATQGLGKSKGRSYYWKEPDIHDHACATFDLLRKYGRPETVLWMLWLQGFSVPLRQFRRVWAARSRTRANWIACPTPQHGPGLGATRNPSRSRLKVQGCVTDVLLQATLALSGTLVPDDGDAAAITHVIERALAWVSRSNGFAPQDNQAAERLWLTVRIMCSALENSDLVSITNDKDLREAQKYLLTAGRLLQRCDDRSLEENENIWPAWLAERMAAPVFILILVLLRSGHKSLLDEIVSRLGTANQRRSQPLVQPVHFSL